MPRRKVSKERVPQHIRVTLETKTGLHRQLIVRASTNTEARRAAMQHYPECHIIGFKDVKLVARKD